MASALTVLLLGCWLAGQSGVSGQGSYPKPTISVRPGGVIPVGGNVTIRCRHQRRAEVPPLQGWRRELSDYTDPAGSEAEFPITAPDGNTGAATPVVIATEQDQLPTRSPVTLCRSL
ncbi:hypothetical protein G0U57_007646 [Chelydra serpentina]|uniref:Ig-like domain-containing protein n=1 Tax=Chelydra serpentina TaxID=8475 RepID=A0A8T1RXW0_CHESE|nr:hypothetical protein G0U57_007646 [Chelydra serpentina]